MLLKDGNRYNLVMNIQNAVLGIVYFLIIVPIYIAINSYSSSSGSTLSQFLPVFAIITAIFGGAIYWLKKRQN